MIKNDNNTTLIKLNEEDNICKEVKVPGLQ